MSAPSADPLRVGCVKYLNAQPLIFGWRGSVLFDHPASLCRKLAAAELDVACVSSFEFLRNPIYSIADDVAVAADGAVYSVFVAHSEPLHELHEILLDAGSATSVALLRCLVAERRMQSVLVADTTCEETPISPRCGRLMIGDQAIRFRQQHRDAYEYWDLAAAWKELTGLPFVFALWLLRPEIDDPRDVADRLRQCRDDNVQSFDEVIAAQREFTPEFCRFYLRGCLRFQLAEQEKAGLLLFRSLCEKHGILPPNQTPLRLI